MTITLADLVHETTTTIGTGTFSLAGAATRRRTFVAGVGDGATVYYHCRHQSADEWESGIGTVTDAGTDTLSRTTILESSNSGSAVNFSAGTKDVFISLPAKRAIFGQIGTTWAPTDVSWIADVDPDTISGSDGDAIATVASGGTAAAFAQSSATLKPLLKKASNGINSHNVIRFDGSNDILTAATGSASLTGDFHVLAVVRISSLTGYQTFVAWGEESNGKRRELIKIGDAVGDDTANCPAFNGYNADVDPTSQAMVANTAYLLEIRSTSGTVTVWRNGTQIATGTPSLVAYTGTTVSLGANNAGGEVMVGDIGRVWIQSSVLSAANIAGLYSYVSNRFGISVSGASSTSNLLPKTTALNQLTDSGIADDGTTITIAGRQINATGSGHLVEHYLTVNESTSGGYGLNVLRLKQLNATGYSCVYGCSHDTIDGVEGHGFAAGWGNTGGSQVFASSGYFEVYNLDSASFYPYRVVQTNNVGNYLRMEVDADIVMNRRDATWPSQAAALTVKNNGDIVPGAAAIATNATAGFLFLPTCAGTPSGTPTTYTGRVAMVYDTTAHKIWVYEGGAWKSTGALS